MGKELSPSIRRMIEVVEMGLPNDPTLAERTTYEVNATGLVAVVIDREAEVSRLQERVKWFEASAVVAAHTEVFTQMHRASEAEYRVVELNARIESAEAGLTRMTKLYADEMAKRAEVLDRLATLKADQLQLQREAFVAGALWGEHTAGAETETDEAEAARRYPDPPTGEPKGER